MNRHRQTNVTKKPKQKKTKGINTYTAPQAAYCSCSGAVRYRHSRRTLHAAAQPRTHGHWPAVMQLYIAIVSRLMVSNPEMDYYSFTDSEER